MNKWIEVLGGKKFIVTMTIIGLSFYGLLIKAITGVTWETIVIFILTIYTGSNVTQRIGLAKTNGCTTSAAPTEPPKQ